MLGRYVTKIYIQMDQFKKYTSNTTDIATVPFRTIGVISHLQLYRYPFVLLERVRDPPAPDPAASPYAARIIIR